ncbi:MAG: sodium:calcium antiporter [Alphaproteobacteria bacterium]|nr:sodium:calcium antiporter [Alphaproteobacteria bacterium]
MNPFADLPLWAALAAFVAAAMVITMAGIRMAETADRLADRTGIGEALFGGVLLGGSTSIPGIVASTTAAAQGHAELAFSNAVGGIAAQTFFLAIADIAYRRANLEHAAASLTNLTQASLLITLLILPLIAVSLPAYTVFEIHPATIAILIGYLFGLRLALRSRTKPMWGPKKTSDTRIDVPREPKGGRRIMMALLLRFAVLAAILMLTGYVTAASGVAIADKTGMSESIIGAYFTAISTSIPELVTTIAAVRRGALTLAMGGIVGGNMFDTLFIASSDIAYRDGSLYHAVSGTPYFLTALSILMTGILLLGMLRRERHGIANIGFESALIFVIYLGGTAILITAG